MGLPGVHSKLWLHQSSMAVSYLPYQLLYFTTLHWSGPSSLEVLSLLCACGRTHPSIHLPIIHLLTYPSIHLSILPSNHFLIQPSFYFSTLSFHLPSLSIILPSIYSSIHPPILPTVYVLINSYIKHSLLSNQARPALKDGF